MLPSMPQTTTPSLLKTWQGFPTIVWAILLGTLLMWGSYFMSMPFLALHLTQHLQASEVITGLVIGISPLMSILCTFWVGYVADRWGRLRMIPFATLGCACVFFAFAGATSILEFLCINALFGIFNTALISNLTAVLSDASSPKNKKAILQMQYYIINVGACLGPLAGSYFFIKGYQMAFIITGALFFACGVFFFIFLKTQDMQSRQHKSPHLSIRHLYITLISDKALVYFLITFMISSCVFSQFDTTFPQYLHQLFDDQGVIFFAQIMVVNALTIILLQFIVLTRLKHLSTTKMMGLGLVPQILGFVLFACLPQNLASFMAAMFVFTLGEILLFSNSNVLIDDMSPVELKSSYFGAIELSRIGQMIGPILGGLILSHLGGKAIFVF